MYALLMNIHDIMILNTNIVVAACCAAVSGFGLFAIRFWDSRSVKRLMKSAW